MQIVSQKSYLKKIKEKFVIGIVGFPLKKPRTINIWKKKLLYINKKISVFEFEIKPSNLLIFLKNLNNLKLDYALAVTMPFKKSIIKFTNGMHFSANRAKAINLFIKFKKKKIGYNTDVLAFNECCKKIIKKMEQIIIVGYGGSGTAIYNYYSKIYKKKIIVISKKIKKKNFYNKIKSNFLKKKSLIVNCTPLGSKLKYNYEKKSPINFNLMKQVNNKSFIFDLVYSPKSNLLSKFCKKLKLRYNNGIRMNTIQANLSFNYIKKIII